MEHDELAPTADDLDDWSDEPSLMAAMAVTRARIEAAKPAHEAARPSITFPLRDKPEHFPAFAARSALFRVGRPESQASEATLEPVRVKAQGGYEIHCQGPRLTMSDKLVWEIALQMAKEASSDLSASAPVSLSEIARRMGWSDRSGKALAWIWTSLQRLERARVSFVLPDGRQGGGALLASVTKSEDGAVSIRLDPDFAWPALSRDKQFRIRFDRRRLLRSSLAQWLHDFFSTHSEARPLTFDYLRELCGFHAKKSRFPASLIEALDELKALAPELVRGYSIDRKRRDSDQWVLTVDRGSEPAEFVMPERREARGSGAASQPARPAPRRALAL